MRLRVVFDTETREEAEYVLGILGQHSAVAALSGLQPIDGLPVDDPAPEVAGTDEPPKRKRGRPRKEDSEPSKLPPESVLDPVRDALAALPDTSPDNGDEPDMFDGTAALSPKEKREKASKMLYALVEADPSKKSAIKKLTEKYGVTFFKDIKDVQVDEFLADAMLLTAQVEADE